MKRLVVGVEKLKPTTSDERRAKNLVISRHAIMGVARSHDPPMKIVKVVVIRVRS